MSCAYQSFPPNPMSLSKAAWQKTTLERKLLKQSPITLRRCLSCDQWMRSTGPDHRLCNPCKGDDTRTYNGGRIFTRYAP